MHGYSLQAQTELLTDYANDHKMTVAGVYADEGVSAAKSLAKRKELMRLISDAENHLFDVILFKDITRWTRNAANYYKVQERLDACKVGWISVQQPYLETVTPTGRFQVTIMLGTSQLESDQVGERIRTVQLSEIRNGYFPFPPHCAPFGYTSQRQPDGHMKLVVNEDQRQLVKDMFALMRKTGNLSEVARLYLSRVPGSSRSAANMARTIRNTVYKGTFNGIDGFCEPIIPAGEWDEANRLIKARKMRKGIHAGEYVFSGLCYCEKCGVRLRPHFQDEKYPVYQCPTLGDGVYIRQDALEGKVLAELEPALRNYEIEITSHKKKGASEKERAKIQSKLSRIKELYIDGIITRTEYDARRTALEAEMPEESPSPEPIKLMDNWRELYGSLSPDRKNVFWKKVIKRITISPDRQIHLLFY